MRTIKITSFRQFHRAIEPFLDLPAPFFRGQANCDWPLIPKVGRDGFSQVEDDYLFAEWKSSSRLYGDEGARTELELLAVAQHHGLATRLLDWSLSPMVAAFFAVWGDLRGTPAVYIYDQCEALPADFPEDPFDIGDKGNVIAWMADPFLPRMKQQRGVFTIHNPPTAKHYVLRSIEKLVRLVIDDDYKARFRDEVAFYGFTRETMFPDFSGSAEHHNWAILKAFPRRTDNANKPQHPTA